MRALSEVTASVDAELIRRHDLCLTWFEVLTALDEHGGSARVSDLTQRVRISQPRVSRVVQAMADRELVSRNPVVGDGRGTVVVFTDSGRRAFEAASNSVSELLEAAIARFFTPEDGGHLMRLGSIVAELPKASD
jgi:DNA-binding MarR family transcriptional regulator